MGHNGCQEITKGCGVIDAGMEEECSLRNAATAEGLDSYKPQSHMDISEIHRGDMGSY